MVRFYGTSALALMTGLALIAWGCDEQFDAGLGGGGEEFPEALPERSAAVEDEFSGFGQPNQQYDQPDQPNQPRPLEAPQADGSTPPAGEAPFSASSESPDAGGSSFPELSPSESDSELPSTEDDAAQRPAAETPEN